MWQRKKVFSVSVNNAEEPLRDLGPKSHRQTEIHTHTHRATPWAPVGAKKSFELSEKILKCKRIECNVINISRTKCDA